ncbi:MAG: RsmD family RNA methyltransferase [Bacteroidaceae bacterium]|nr:RsmD family RNA methyltransferase [Bacteroidaceae bacterium]
MMLDAETAKFIQEHREADVRTLALQAGRYPKVNIPVALTQIEGWQLARHKLPTWATTEGVLYPPRISMEQCSSEATAQYKASLIKGKLLADLTGGFGIDCSYMSRKVEKAIYIERNSTLCQIARKNFDLLALNHIDIINSECEEELSTLPQCNWIFADPARRSSSGSKVVFLSDCEPDITTLEEKIMQHCDNAMIKCSPMLDISAACRQLQYVREVHCVAVGNECKELLLILRKEESKETILHCINIQKGETEKFDCTLENCHTAIYADEPKHYLYEPNAAIQKGNCHNALSKKFSAAKLHPNSHLFTSDERIENFPGRSFRILGWTNFSKNGIKELLYDTKKANITVRNFPDNVQTLRKRLKITEGGDIFLFATTLRDDRKVLIKCQKIETSS